MRTHELQPGYRLQRRIMPVLDILRQCLVFCGEGQRLGRSVNSSVRPLGFLEVPH